MSARDEEAERMAREARDQIREGVLEASAELRAQEGRAAAREGQTSQGPVIPDRHGHDFTFGRSDGYGVCICRAVENTDASVRDCLGEPIDATVRPCCGTLRATQPHRPTCPEGGAGRLIERGLDQVVELTEDRGPELPPSRSCIQDGCTDPHGRFDPTGPPTVSTAQGELDRLEERVVALVYDLVFFGLVSPADLEKTLEEALAPVTAGPRPGGELEAYVRRVVGQLRD